MEAADIWTISVAGASAVIAIVAAVAAWVQVRRAGEQVTVARKQAGIAEDAATSARTQAEAATEQLRLARSQAADDRVQRAREIHDELHDELREVIHKLDPKPEQSARQLRSRHVADNAAPHMVEVERLARRLADVGAPRVASAYKCAHSSATRVTDYIRTQLTERGGGLELQEVAGFADGFESLMRELNREAERAAIAWRRWRDEQGSSVDPQ